MDVADESVAHSETAQAARTAQAREAGSEVDGPAILARSARPKSGTSWGYWLKRNVNRLVGLLAITAFAVAVAVAVSAGGRGERDEPGELAEADAAPAAPVAVIRVEKESVEIIDSYPGLIEPRERFSLGFEIPGRLVEFGRNELGKDLDEGDRVKAGQLLARLDDRNYQYQLAEAQAAVRQASAQLLDAKARLEDAQSDLGRADQLRRAGGRAITESEYQDFVTKVSVAQAQVDTAEAQAAIAAARVQTATKALEDARLVSPVDGVVSARLLNLLESVSPHQPVFEILEVEEVLLVLGVPEAYEAAIRPGQSVHVELLARDQFGRPRPSYQGTVFRVGQSADQTTGLFKVEVLVSNPTGELKPGLIARAGIVVDEIAGFRIPIGAAIFRDSETYLFAAGKDGRAHRVALEDWIEQGRELILQELPAEHRTIVVRGQHRLIEGRKVRIVELEGVPLEQAERDLLLRDSP